MSGFVNNGSGEKISFKEVNTTIDSRKLVNSAASIDTNLIVGNTDTESVDLSDVGHSFYNDSAHQKYEELSIKLEQAERHLEDLKRNGVDSEYINKLQVEVDSIRAEKSITKVDLLLSSIEPTKKQDGSISISADEIEKNEKYLNEAEQKLSEYKRQCVDNGDNEIVAKKYEEMFAKFIEKREYVRGLQLLIQPMSETDFREGIISHMK